MSPKDHCPMSMIEETKGRLRIPRASLFLFFANESNLP